MVVKLLAKKKSLLQSLFISVKTLNDNHFYFKLLESAPITVFLVTRVFQCVHNWCFCVSKNGEASVSDVSRIAA